MQNTILSNFKTIDVSRIVLDKPVVGTVPGQSMTFQRVNVGIKNPDGTTGNLIVATPRVFTLGVEESLDMATKAKNGYQLPIFMYSRDGATPDEKLFVDTFEKIIARVKELVFEHREAIGHDDLVPSDLRNIKAFYRRKTATGKVDPTAVPMLYLKTMYSKKNDKIVSDFHDARGVTIDPLTILGKYAHVVACIRIESVFVIGPKISIQVKLHEAEIELFESGPSSRRLLKPSAAMITPVEDEEDEEDDDEFAVDSTDDEE